MRDPRYRFTDDVRATTRAIALRMIHRGHVAQTVSELDDWIASTDDLRETLSKAGYGSAFTAEDLFPLFQSFVAKARASASVPGRSGGGTLSWQWLGVIITAAIACIAFAIAVASR